MSISVGLRTSGSEAKSVASSPSATVKRLSDWRAASGPTPPGLAANKADAARATGQRSKDVLFIEVGIHSACALFVGVEILAQIFAGDRAIDSVGGHFGVRGPEQRVEDDLAEVLIAPILVGVPAGETKPAP